MTDPVAATLDALARHDVVRLPAAFAAGALTSIGPCVAPRYVAVAAVLQRGGRRVPAVLVFVAGLLAGYAVLGFGAGIVGSLVAHAGVLYVALAAGLVVCGLVQLLRNPAPAGHQHGLRGSGTFALGAGSTLIVSPCCTPIVAAIAGMGAFDGRPAISALFLATFALGHALPLLALAVTGSLFAGPFATPDGRALTATISGTLMLALGAYYGMLA